MNNNISQTLIDFKQLMYNNDIDIYIIYMGDIHNSEHPGKHDKRITFLSAFTGSAGRCLITQNEALLWTDGRYFTQAINELENGWSLMKMNFPGVPTMTEYLSNLDSNQKIGVDSSTATIAEFNILKNTLKNNVVKLIHPSLVDEYMGDKQPQNEANLIIPHPLHIAGVTTKEKINIITNKLKSKKLDCLFISALDEIAYVLNLRGNDITNIPIFYSFLFISLNKIIIFINKKQLTKESENLLENDSIEIQPYEFVNEFLKNYYINFPNSKIWMDPRTNANIYFNILNYKNNVLLEQSPIVLMKSIKNEFELKGMEIAHLKDSVALTKFYYWAEQCLNDKSIFNFTEYEINQKLFSYRNEQEGFKCTSMSGIVGNGSNGAIIHYRPHPTKSAKIQPSMLLIDSGGQYTEGSTDITRTIHLGVPTEFEKKCFTLVLKGHIALATAIFPQTTKGPQLDILARQYLWAHGLDYFHGTGHGVGAVLNIHEGPINIASQLVGPAATTEFTVGMIVSNEPGFYDTENKFGIRIENLITVEKAETENNFAGVSYNKFKTISLFPIDTQLIDFKLMTEKEIEWLNNYHKIVYEKVSKILQSQSINNNENYTHYIDWLKIKTQQI